MKDREDQLFVPQARKLSFFSQHEVIMPKGPMKTMHEESSFTCMPSQIVAQKVSKNSNKLNFKESFQIIDNVKSNNLKRRYKTVEKPKELQINTRDHYTNNTQSIGKR